MAQFFQGKPVSRGIAMGPVVYRKKEKYIIEKKQVADADAELVRLEKAVLRTGAQLEALRQKTLREEATVNVAESAPAGSALLEAYRMLLEDESFVGQMRECIQTETVNAEYAVEQVGQKIAGLFAGMADDYMRERAVDVRNVTEYLLKYLGCGEGGTLVWEEPSIILAEELSPAETIQFDKRKVSAIVTREGSEYSHTAILARSMGIPALVGVDVKQVRNCYEIIGKPGADRLSGKANVMSVIVDAVQGCLVVNPDRETTENYQSLMQQEQERKALLLEYRNRESVTLDGKKVPVCANVGNALEVREALECKADGIGLFRSEFLYLGRSDFPTEEEQLQEYKRVLVAMGEKRVIIRTMDIGSDKQAESLGLEPEENPALGYRGIRISLGYPEMFRTQLRALLRAAVYGNLAVMYPMITSVEEVEQIQALVEQVAGELEQEGIAYRIPLHGIMIETPAAAMISDELAEKVDFFSIGTNDLTQYALAADRQNGKLEAYYNPRHKAVLRMIEMTVKNAHKAGKWVGICGELAADTAYTQEMVRMGVDELSVISGKVLEVRKAVSEIRITR